VERIGEGGRCILGLMKKPGLQISLGIPRRIC
jgi:hypothetical protein